MFTSTKNVSLVTDKVAETYLLASKVKTKLTNESVKNDINLVKLVTQANLLDKLIENINKLQVKSSSSKFTFESIDENLYPLLNTGNASNYINMTFNQNYYSYEDDNDDYNTACNDDSIHIETNTIYTGDFNGSDDSDFGSDYSSDSDDDADCFTEFKSPSVESLGSCINSDQLCDSLENLNICSEFENGIVEETDPAEWQNDNYDHSQEITCEAVSDTESESSTFSSDENDFNSIETVSNNNCNASIEHQNEIHDLPLLSKFQSNSSSNSNAISF